MPFRHLLLGCLAALLWGASFITSRWALDAGAPPLGFTACRLSLVGALALFHARPLGWRTLLVLGTLIGFGLNGLPILALSLEVPAGIAALGMQMQTFITVALAAAPLGEQPRAAQLAGIGLGIGGLTLLAHPQAGAQVPLLGLGVLLAAATSWAVGNLILRRAGRTANAAALTAWSCAVGSPITLGASFLLEGDPRNSLGMITQPAVASACLVYGALGPSLAATLGSTWLLRRYPAATVAPLSLLASVSGVALSYLLLGEEFAFPQFLAGLLMLVGLGLVSGTASGRTPRAP